MKRARPAGPLAGFFSPSGAGTTKASTLPSTLSCEGDGHWWWSKATRSKHIPTKIESLNWFHFSIWCALPPISLRILVACVVLGGCIWNEFSSALVACMQCADVWSVDAIHPVRGRFFSSYSLRLRTQFILDKRKSITLCYIFTLEILKLFFL